MLASCCRCRSDLVVVWHHFGKSGQCLAHIGRVGPKSVNVSPNCNNFGGGGRNPRAQSGGGAPWLRVSSPAALCTPVTHWRYNCTHPRVLRSPADTRRAPAPNKRQIRSGGIPIRRSVGRPVGRTAGRAGGRAGGRGIFVKIGQTRRKPDQVCSKLADAAGRPATVAWPWPRPPQHWPTSPTRVRNHPQSWARAHKPRLISTL